MREFIKLLGVAIVAGTLSAASPASGATSAFVGNNYESMSNLTTCTSTVCGVVFPPVPAGKTVLVTRVQCKVQTAGNLIFMHFGPSPVDTAFGTSDLTKKTYFEEIFSAFAVENNSNYKVLQSIPMIHIGAGRFPKVYVGVTATSLIYMECALAGVGAN